MAKKKPRSVQMNEVVVKATPLKKAPTTTALYPRGEVKNKQLDSIQVANPAVRKLIGKPITKPGIRPQFTANQSEIIKQAIKPKPLPKGEMLAASTGKKFKK